MGLWVTPKPTSPLSGIYTDAATSILQVLTPCRAFLVTARIPTKVSIDEFPSNTRTAQHNTHSILSCVDLWFRPVCPEFSLAQPYFPSFSPESTCISPLSPICVEHPRKAAKYFMLRILRAVNFNDFPSQLGQGLYFQVWFLFPWV